MRLRPRHRTATAPLLLLLLPALAASLNLDPKQKPGSVEHLAHEGAQKVGTVGGSSHGSSYSDSAASVKKLEPGRKDAPVDGLDGKPHAGPFVETTKKKPTQQVEDLGSIPASKKGSSEKTLNDNWELPEDDGVMSDVKDRGAVTGPTGTEGGVSQKDRERKEKGNTEKRPDPPKTPPGSTVHGSTADKQKPDSSEPEKKKGAVGIEKPADLPDKPHDIPHPQPPSLPKTDFTKGQPTVKVPGSKIPSTGDDDSILHPFHSFILSFTMIIFSEIGDKTFLVAALMAMRHARLVVFSAAFSALIVMTVLSAVLGHAVPTLLPKRLTNFAAAVLFFVFGAKLLREGLAMDPEEGVGEEMKEVEMELEEKEQEMRRYKRRASSTVSPYVLESGRARRSRSSSQLPAIPRSPSTSPSPPPSPSKSAATSALSGLNNLFSLLLSPAWVQTFVMTFLGEWGDRSQIATIAMAAGQDYWWVTGGAVVGHGLCTAAAVVGGRAIAGRVSMRVVTLGGAVAFLVFGVIYFAEALYS